jgi:hypothetical protein
MLQGCGCDKSGTTTCSADCVTNSPASASAPCANLDCMIKCIKDKGCCDYEENGVKMKDSLKAAFALVPTCTNACA